MKIQAVRGMQDLLPDRRERYRYIEDTARGVLRGHGYREIGLPLLESTGLFERLVGKTTDIVEKEMYTFDERGGDSVTLRPEGTAGCVRAALENGLLFNQTHRLWYSGAMFRYERPQKGRYRQFEQIGIECFGMTGPDIDVEILRIMHRILEELGVRDQVQLEINTMGDAASRAAYRDALVDFFAGRETELDEDSRRRLTTNPLRILDSKVESTRALVEAAPRLWDFVDQDSKDHFETLRRHLDRAQLPYVINPYIVRGLDYYNKTVFEFTTDALGAQGTVCGGGRYDGLVEELGGRATPAVGFAMGLDRLALLLEDRFEPQASADVYIASMGEDPRMAALLLADEIRAREPSLKVMVHCGDGKFKSQLKKADASGAMLALILGEDEVEGNRVTLKKLRVQSEQTSVDRAEIADHVQRFFATAN